MARASVRSSRFARSFRGEIIAPGDPGYDAARRVWNGMFDRRPALIVRPTNVEEVQAAVRLGREQDWVIAVRCGGHSMTGMSTCDDGLLIDLSAMRGVTVDPVARTARADGGALLSELDAASQAHGLVCPVGIVGHTGVGGLTLGGGLGRLMRRFGYTIDNLAAVELVTADGRHVRVSEDEHPDLFWGIRGAGPNFGIVTAFEYRLHPFGPEQLRGSRSFPAARVFEVWTAFLELAETGPREITGISFGIDPPSADEEAPAQLRDGPVVSVGWAHVGPESAAERDLARLLGIPSLQQEMMRGSYLEIQSRFDEQMAWGQRSYSKAAFGRELQPATLDALLEHATVIRGEAGISALGQGGAIRDLPGDAAAFAGREATFWMSAECLWREPERDAEMRDWTRRAIAIVEPEALSGNYVNGVGDAETDLVDVYGQNKQARLRALKQAWDPDNTFRLNQNIRP